MAWLTDAEILKALASKKSVCIIVQKEDFQRPDIDVNLKEVDWKKKWKIELRQSYDKLKCNLEREDFDQNILSFISTHSIDTTLEAVRCVGNKNRHPLMHNKFLVFASYKNYNRPVSGYYDYGKIKIKPYAVWTGSFNFTKNSQNSLENALLIKDPLVVHAYYKEFGQIYAMSEPLDWTVDWVKPKWRIGS